MPTPELTRLTLFRSGRFDAYVKDFDDPSGVAPDRFVEYLLETQSAAA